MSCASKDSGCACLYCELGREIDRLKAEIAELASRHNAIKSGLRKLLRDQWSENSSLKSRIADLELAVSPIDEQAVRLGRLRRDKAVSAIDPDMPRRFRFPVEESHGIEGGWRYAVYFPRNKRWTTEYAYESRGRDAPDMPGLEWIDPAPTPKDAKYEDR